MAIRSHFVPSNSPRCNIPAKRSSSANLKARLHLGTFAPPHLPRSPPDPCNLRTNRRRRLYSLGPWTGVFMQPRAIMTHTPQPLSRACATKSRTYGCQKGRQNTYRHPQGATVLVDGLDLARQGLCVTHHTLLLMQEGP